MNRKEFFQQCGTCLGVAGLWPVAGSCTASRRMNAPINAHNQLEVPLSSFIASSGDGQIQYKRYLIVGNDRLNYPIVVFRDPANIFTALLLRCSHQYSELNVNGDLLTCPAHGSEFNTKGEVVHGPAEYTLRSFTTTSDAQNLLINLA